MRTEHLLKIRPEIPKAKITTDTTDTECFQNKTLRPIIKFQHDLIIAVFKSYIKKRKNVFFELQNEKQLHFIENAIHKDLAFRNTLIGIITGFFTINEYISYSKDTSVINRRMLSIIKTRLIDSIQLFTKS